MATLATSAINYDDLSHELSSIMAELEKGDLGVDAAATCYERGLQIIKTLEEQIMKAEHRINELRAEFDADEEE